MESPKQSTVLSQDDRERLLQAASEVAVRAYAPYSGIHVGAAVLTGCGEVYQGCNVENASYGLTICAERAAIFNAVSGEGGDALEVRAIAVVTSDQMPISPCGACRQVIAEFGPDVVVVYRASGGIRSTTIRELLPDAFQLD
ncbi:MAG: cytidine deaminase [Thermomicrobiales bacterium]